MKNYVVFDVECYKNVFQVRFKHVATGKIIGFEKSIFKCGRKKQINFDKLSKVMSSFTICGFNSYTYDIPMIKALFSGLNNRQLKHVSDHIINSNLMPWNVDKHYDLDSFPFIYDAIDLINVCPEKRNLKLLGGRLHASELEDLPYEPDRVLTFEEAEHLAIYCDKDLKLTETILHELEEELGLRDDLGNYYQMDLRSKSDAQIAEAVFKNKCNYNKDYEFKLERFRYEPPSYIEFNDPKFKDLLDQYTTTDMELDDVGHIIFNFKFEEKDRIKSGKNKGKFPDRKKLLKIEHEGKSYGFGVGGVHSREKAVSYYSNEEYIILAPDVTSYYPRVIINNGLYPPALGTSFKPEYSSVVERRILEKNRGNKKFSDGLKIVINGGFGKFGSHYSCFYSPDIMAKITITGQLSMLMLLEMMTEKEIEVLSVNTDGIILMVPRSRHEEVNTLIELWEKKTGLNMESEIYTQLHCSSVSDYIAIKSDGSIKGKGAYADQSSAFYRLRKNPANMICIEAVKNHLLNGSDIMGSLHACRDITKFTILKTANGGAYCESHPNMGKTVRFYYSRTSLDAIYYKKSGNRLPDSIGSRILMDLPSEFPKDIDYVRYYDICVKLLNRVGISI